MVLLLDVVNCGALLQHPQIPGSRLLVCGEFYHSKTMFSAGWVALSELYKTTSHPHPPSSWIPDDPNKKTQSKLLVWLVV